MIEPACILLKKSWRSLQDPIVFDIGANIGNHALRMSAYSKKIYLFEPQVKIFAHLQTTMALNQLTTWEIFNFGLSDEETTLPLYESFNGNNGETSFIANLNGNNIATEQALLHIGDNIVRDHAISQIDFIKIDVEGFEAKVIAGLKHSIIKFRPVIFMEWDKAITKQQFNDMHLFDTVFNGYEIRAITRNPNEVSLPKKIWGKIQRLFDKNIPQKRKILGEFIAQRNYRHIIFIPQEKIHLLGTVYNS